MRPRANVPPRSTNPGCERPQGSGLLEHAIRADGGRWAGDCGGSPHAHRGLRHSQQGSWRPTEQGAPRRSPRGGLRGPSRCALHREERGGSDGAAGLILPGGPSYPPPSRIILERINYEIVN